MRLTPENLKAVLDKGDDKTCLQMCLEATEAERKAVASVAADWAALQAKHPFIETDHTTLTSNPLLPAARVATLACCSIGPLKKLGWRGCPETERAHAILAARRPPWIDDWVESVGLETPWQWGFVRRLVREGLCQRPAGDNYILGMLGRAFYHSGYSIRQVLEADPELLDYEVWRLFELEGNGEFSLAAHDKYSRPELTWATAFIELATEGKIARARLLDASLDALERDFAQFRAGWFSRFHEALAPTLEERAERAGRYLGLVASRIPPTVSFALKSLQILDKAGRLPATTLVDQIQPALAARPQGTVKTALGFLDRAARREPALKPQIAIAAALALGHETSAVQGAALDLIKKHGDPGANELVALLKDKLDGLAASQKPRLLDWLGCAAKPADTQAAKVVAKGARAVHKHAPRALQPIDTLDELIDLFATVIEDAASPDDVERVLDGVSRLCAERPDDFAARTAPLAKRAQALIKRARAEPFVAMGPAHDLCGVALAWITGAVRQGERERRHPPHLTVFDFLSARALSVARRAGKQQAAPLLCAPTHEGGWLDPLVLVERVKAWERLEDTPDIYDQVQALLRLAPDRRPVALRKAGKFAGEWGDAVHFALGADNVAVGPSAPLWVAAARARDPFADADAVEKRHPGLGPDAGLAARYGYRIKSKEHRGSYMTASGPKQFHNFFHEFLLDRQPALPKKVPLELPTVLLHGVSPVAGATALRWATLVWPAARESWFAEGARRLAQNLDWWEADWGNRLFLEPLLDPMVPLKPMALLALVFGLAAKEPGESGLATDALIRTIEDGRLDAVQLGTTLAALLPTGILKAARLARTLGDAARISPSHADALTQVIEHALQHDPAKAPRDLLPFLELLHELLVGTGQTLTLGGTESYLTGLNASGKTARVVSKLRTLVRV